MSVIPSRPRLISALRRLPAAVLAAALLAACGGAAPSAPTVAPSPTSATAPTSAAAPTAAPTAAPRPTEAPKPTEAPTGDVKVVEAVFATSLTENMEPDGVADDSAYEPTDTIALSLKLEGRPKQGELTAVFYWQDQELDSATIDLADTNGDVIFSIGENTFVGFTLKPSTVWPISEQYRVEVALDGEPLDTYTYKVIPPADAVETEIIDVVLAEGADQQYSPVNPGTEFLPDQEVFLVGTGNFEAGSWLRGEWYVDGELDEQGTRLLGPLTEDLEATGFSFSFRPESNWPEGEHEVVLTVNDQEVGRYQFTITTTPSAVTGDPSGELAIGALETYTAEEGLFTIDVPEGWERTDNSEAGSVSAAWYAPEGTAGIFVALLASDETFDEEALIAFGTQQVQNLFESEPGFELRDAEPQRDGSVLIPFTVVPELGGQPVELVGLAYIEQRGDKISSLMVLYPAAQRDELWESHFNQIVNSYKIDESVTIP